MIPSDVMAGRLNVLVTMPFGEARLDRLRAVSPDLAVAAGDPETADYARTDVLYAGSPPRDLARAPRLKWVQVHMAGVNALHDHPLYTESAVPITTTSGVHAATIAEYALTVILALAHRVPRMVEWRQRGGWPPDAQRWPLFVPAELRGAALGVIGYGSIGRELARMAKAALGMTVLALKRDPSRRADDGYVLPGTGDPAGTLPDAWFAPLELRDLLARADVAVMCAPLTPETRLMIGAAELAAMKPEAFFVNVGRGATVDESALAAALAAGRLAGAAVDVFAEEPPPAGHPLYALDNAIVSPHVSGFLPSYDDRCTDLFAENLRRFLAGAPLLNLVDRARGY
jgi:phosphoglycerate dehydrogenase-like enzyme